MAVHIRRCARHGRWIHSASPEKDGGRDAGPSPVELLALRDVERASKLVAEWVATLKPGMHFIP